MFSRCIVVGLTVHQPHKRRINYLRGIHPEDFCECPVDMRQIVKTGLQSEVGKFQTALPKQRRPPHRAPASVLTNGESRLLFEQLSQPRRRQMHLLGQ